MKRSAPLKFSEAELIEMEHLYEIGWSVQRIGKRFGCLSGSIHARLVKRGNVRTRTAAETRRLRPLPVRVDASGYLAHRGVRVHRLIAARMIGRSFVPGEVVHHKNGDRLDNRPENLVVFPSNGIHMGEHASWGTTEEAQMIRYRLGGLSARETAERMGLSENRVRGRWSYLQAKGEVPKIRAGRKKGR